MEICCSTFANWDDWLADKPSVPFSQSMMWGRLLAEEGKDIEFLQAVEDGKIFAQALVVHTALPFGFSYVFSPKGPVILNTEDSRLKIKNIYEAFANYFKKQGAIFWRVEPSEFRVQSSEFRVNKVFDVNPRATTVLAIGRTAEVILNGMHQKTRYNIHLAEKKGVIVREEKNWDIFWRLMQLTGERDGFRLHDKKHYEHILGSSFSRQLVALAEGKPVATAVFVGFGKTFTYLYGASDYEYRQFMAPYLVQWEGIQLGKRLGHTQYDTFGIAPGAMVNDEYSYDEKHQYAGVTRFKLGFGGAAVQAPGAFDLIISPWRYKLYQVLRKIRRLF